MSLYDELLKVYENENTHYYNRINVNPIKTPNESFQFIKQYFSEGFKSKVFDFPIEKKFKCNGKHKHTVSLYYLGILMRDLVEKELEEFLIKNICKNNSKKLGFDFSYIWFLCCLYHDVAYVYENEAIISSDIELKDFLDKELEIKHDVYDSKLNSSSYKRYPKKLVSNYFKYILIDKDLRKYEHGILGGYLLYDRLIKNYDDKYELLKQHNNKSIDYNNFIYSELENCKKFCIEQHDLFAFISNAIISHNIWLCTNKDDEEKYKKYKLDQLIVNEHNKLSLKKDNLVFFLALLDTIEPIKQFNNNTEEVWKNFEINFDKKNKRIKIDIINKDVFNKDETNKWNSKIKELEEWSKVKVKTEGNISLTTSIYYDY